MKLEKIDLAEEMRRIASELDRCGSSRTREYTYSKYDTDLMRDAAMQLAELAEAKERAEKAEKDVVAYRMLRDEKERDLTHVRAERDAARAEAGR